MRKLFFWLCLTVVTIVPFANDIFVAALPQVRDHGADLKHPRVSGRDARLRLGDARVQRPAEA